MTNLHDSDGRASVPVAPRRDAAGREIPTGYVERDEGQWQCQHCGAAFPIADNERYTLRVMAEHERWDAHTVQRRRTAIASRGLVPVEGSDEWALRRRDVAVTWYEVMDAKGPTGILVAAVDAHELLDVLAAHAAGELADPFRDPRQVTRLRRALAATARVRATGEPYWRAWTEADELAGLDLIARGVPW